MTNPLLAEWTTPFAAPPFAAIAPGHYPVAFTECMAEQLTEVDAIAGNPAPPTFDNTIVALERSGERLDRAASVFFNLIATDASDELQAIETEFAPRFAQHNTRITANDALFARIDALHRQRQTLGLAAEQLRLLERKHLDFVRDGAALPAPQKKRYGEIMERLSVLGTSFRQNLLADEAAYALVLDGEADLAGLPEFLRAAMQSLATERGHDGKHVVTLNRSIIEPFLTFSSRRDLREQAFNAWVKRGANGGDTDNRAIITEMLRLRLERANLLGYATYADYVLDDTMAKSADTVDRFLRDVWRPAVRRLAGERQKLQAAATAKGHNEPVRPWDWRYYAEQVRKAEYDLDEAELKPYFSLERIIEAAFYTAERLFGLSFLPRPDVPTYHPEVRAFEVRDGAGNHLGLFLADYFARASKRSGAWMSGFRAQHNLPPGGGQRPIVVNVLNFAKGAAGTPSLLSIDDALTLFHEFGHALHGLMSDVTYPTLSGTNVARDFVELPSQLYEHWLETPEILSRFARHATTGEPMPAAMIDKIRASRTFNQGCQTIEYLSSAMVDIAFHRLTDFEGVEPLAFEQATLAAIGMPGDMVMRHATPHFQHIFADDAYSAGYYSYLWSEVLDADAFEAFRERGDVFDRQLGDKLARNIYAAGATRAPEAAYIGFRGRLPTIEGLLKKRGLETEDDNNAAR